MKIIFHILCAAFAAFLFYIVPETALGQTSNPGFYDDTSVHIPWPASIEPLKCPAELQAKVGEPCIQLGASDAALGAVFWTLHSGYALGSAAALEAHLKSSEEALAGIPNVHVMQSRVLKETPLLGFIEILRKDGGLKEIPALSQPPVRQTSILVPTGDKLAQVFIYLPLEGEDVAKVYTDLVETMTSGIVVHDPPVLPTVQATEKVGTMRLLPKALMLGAALALVGIFIIRFRRRKTD